LKNVKVLIPKEAIKVMGIQENQAVEFKDRLDSPWIADALGAALSACGLELPDLTPCTALILEIVK